MRILALVPLAERKERIGGSRGLLGARRRTLSRAPAHRNGSTRTPRWPARWLP